jgi:imidazolonepropionase-like amidohydrolase
MVLSDRTAPHRMRRIRIMLLGGLAATGLMLSAEATSAPLPEGATAAPAPARDEGEGPFDILVIRGVTVIDGLGGPPIGPMDIVIEGNRIADIIPAGTPDVPLEANRPPHNATREIDAEGAYVLPGFVDAHAHGSVFGKAPDLSYGYKLWLAHGVTTIRSVTLADAATSAGEKARSARNEIAAPRIFNYQTIGAGWSGGRVETPDQARAWVRWAAKNNVDGVKIFNRGDETTAIIEAAVEEAAKLKLGSVAHLSQINVGDFNAEDAGDAGVGSITHFYGHFEALLKDETLAPYSNDYNYADEAKRFGQIPNLRHKAWGPGTEPWNAYLERQEARGVTFNPTFNIYSASRDLMKARTSEWHDKYTMPQLWNFFQSKKENHGSYFYDWTSENEYDWKQFFILFEKLVRDYSALGGRVTVGTDPGFIYKTWGFSYVEELEMLREAGFTPLEIMRAATSDGAAEIYAPKGEPAPFGAVRRGMLADLVIVDENPLENLKVLYGTGHRRLNLETGEIERVGGVRYTIKDGIVYDAKALLEEVAQAVAEEKARMGAPD